MPNYKLGVTYKKEGRIIDLDKVVDIKKIQTLDKFTMDFKNELELKTYLLKKDVLTNVEVNRTIQVFYRNSGKLKHIPVLYSDMKKYLDYYYLDAKVKSLSSDSIFLEKLANHYANGKTTYNKQGLNVSDIRVYLGDVRSSGHHHSSTLLQNALTDLVKKAVLTIDYKTGEVKENYRGLRDIALFMYDYIEKEEMKRQEQIKKEEKKEEWEQINFFDSVEKTKEYCLNNIEEDEDDFEEPLFPPNSEEEARYLRYLEEEERKFEEEYDIESHPHYGR